MREAINNSANPGTDTTGGDCAVFNYPTTPTDDITFSVSGTIQLVSTLPTVFPYGKVTIDGTGQSITINGENSYEILSADGKLTLNDLTFENGSYGYGGAIDNENSLTVTNCTFSGNSATGSFGEGGAIYNDGTLTVNNSTFSGNSATHPGGAIYSNGTVTVTNSTFSGNSAATGGGIYNNAATSAVTVTSSILATSTGGNCAGTGTPPVTDDGYSISDDATCSFTYSQNSTNPLLATAGLANNGGPTYTIALQATSPAIGLIPNPTSYANCPGFDQRGAPRPAPTYTDCDSGAYEYGGVVP